MRWERRCSARLCRERRLVGAPPLPPPPLLGAVPATDAAMASPAAVLPPPAPRCRVEGPLREPGRLPPRFPGAPLGKQGDDNKSTRKGKQKVYTLSLRYTVGVDGGVWV